MAAGSYLLWSPVNGYNPDPNLIRMASAGENTNGDFLAQLGGLGLKYSTLAGDTLKNAELMNKLYDKRYNDQVDLRTDIYLNQHPELMTQLTTDVLDNGVAGLSRGLSKIGTDPETNAAIRARLSQTFNNVLNTGLQGRNIEAETAQKLAQRDFLNQQAKTEEQRRDELYLRNSLTKEGVDQTIAFNNLTKNSNFITDLTTAFRENPYINYNELHTLLAEKYPEMKDIPIPYFAQNMDTLRKMALSVQAGTDMQTLVTNLNELKNGAFAREVLSRINLEGLPSTIFLSPELYSNADPGQRLGFFSTPQGQELARQKGIDPAKGNMLFDKAGGGMYRVVNQTIEALRKTPEYAKLPNDDITRAIVQHAVVRAFSNVNSFWDWVLNEEGTSVDTKFDEKDVIPIAKKMLTRYNEVEKPLKSLFGPRGALTYEGLQPILTQVQTGWMAGKGTPLELLEAAIQKHAQKYYNSPAGQYLSTQEQRAQFEQAIRESFTTGPRSPFYLLTPPVSGAEGANAILQNPDLLINPSSQEGIDQLKNFRQVDNNFEAQIRLKEAELALPETQADSEKTEKLQKEIAALKTERQKLDPYRESVETKFDREREGQTDSRLYNETITEVIQDPSKYDRYFPILQRGYDINQAKVKNARSLPPSLLITPEMELDSDNSSIQDPGAKTNVNFKDFYTKKHSELSETIKRIESHRTTGLADYEETRLPQLKKELQTLEKIMKELGIQIKTK